jgi:putative acetyltransferase
MGEVTIREEREADWEGITAVTVAAFRGHPHSRQTEQFIVQALRKAGAMTISLVAELEGRVVGPVAFSPVVISDGSAGWYGVGPLSVAPELQRWGIGRRLMEEGLGRRGEGIFDF